MNRFVRVLLSRSKTLTIVLLLVVLPWLGSIYFCSQSRENDAAANSSSPNLLAPADSARCLLTSDTQTQSNPTAEFPGRQTADPISAPTQPDNSAEGPKLTDPAQTEKPKLASISPSGIIEEDFGELSAASSPPVWKPKEMPIADKTSESSPVQTTSTDDGPNDGLAVDLPNQGKNEPSNQPAAATEQQSPPLDEIVKSPDGENNPSGQSASNVESSPVPKSPGAAAASASSAKSAPAAKNSFVDDRSEAPATDREQACPSTKPPSTQKAAKTELPVRSEQLESIARQADQLTRHGLELAGRGAFFAARSQFISSLRLIAQGLDADGKTKIHGKSLAAGFLAMKEAEDFLPAENRLEADLDLSAIIAGHSTPVLKDADTASLTSLTALKSYLTFAQAQLAQAAGSEVAGSMALRGLGKLHEELAKGKGPGTKAAGPKAIVFYQAALAVCPLNFMAANDLGVMFARNGNFDDARKILEYSLSLNKQSTVWHNLAVVYEHLALGDKARQAQQQALLAMQIEQARLQKMQASAGGQVRWVDENSFADSYNSSKIPQTAHPGAVVAANSPIQRPAPARPRRRVFCSRRRSSTSQTISTPAQGKLLKPPFIPCPPCSPPPAGFPLRLMTLGDEQ